MPCPDCGHESYRTCGCNKVIKYPDCNGLYPHSITKEGCVYCNQMEKLDTLINPPLTLESLEGMKKTFEDNEIDTSAGAINMLVTRKELNTLRNTPWYSRILYSVSDWLMDISIKIEDIGIWLEGGNYERT